MFFYYNNKEYDLARPCFELAAQLNNSDALNYLGIYYKKGINVDKNYNLSFQYFQRSAEQNNPAAYYNLGQAYYYGFGVEKNYSKAIEYYELSVKQDYVEAIIQLAYCYLTGVGVEVNLKKAIEYYEYLEPKIILKHCLILELFILMEEMEFKKIIKNQNIILKNLLNKIIQKAIFI